MSVRHGRLQPLAVAAALSLAATSHAAPGEWPCEHGGGRLDGRATVKGRITEPRVIWQQFIGVVDVKLLVKPGPKPADLLVDPAARPATAPELSDSRWGLTPALGEIEGATKPLYTDAGTTYADVLPEAPGLEKLAFESGFSKPTVGGQWQPVRGYCQAWRDGRWTQVWQTELLDMLFSALPLAGDFDGDGKLEVAILPWYELLILDARTGVIKDRCKFTEGRSYGYFGVHDLDGDGKREFLVEADFSKHVDVLGYREGKLSLLWRHQIEPDISNPQKILRVNPRSAADVDGDGRLEVLISCFNDGGDQRWHLSLRDGITGAVKADLADEYLQGVCDVNGDGRAELLTVATSGAGVPAWGRIRVHGLRDGKPVTLWERADSAWQTWEPPTPLNVNTAATEGRLTVLCREADGRARVVLGRRVKGEADEVLEAASWTERGFRPGMTVRGRNLRAPALDPNGSLLVRSTTRPGESCRIRTTRGAPKPLAAGPRGGAAGVVVVARDPRDGRSVIAAQGADEELVILKVPRGGAAGECRRLPGRGQSTNWPGEARGPVIADLAGDGGRQIIYATSASGGCARLAVADLALREVWHHDFPEIPGTPPVWNTGGLILWQVGHFTDPRRLDVLATVRRSMMHSEETALLSGMDGRELWQRNREIGNRGVGGAAFAIADFDGDGLDDAASLYPSELYILRGRDGQDVIAMPAKWKGVPTYQVYWAQPIAGDFEGTGKPALFCGSARGGITALLRPDGKLVWWDALECSPNVRPAIGEVDGDGRLEAVGWGYPDGIRCYDTATGKRKWTLPGPEPGTPAGLASGDLDSDGRDEIVATVGVTIYCLAATAAGDAGVVRWKVGLPATLGPPTIADLDGQVSIVVIGADGRAYCVG